MRRFCTFETTFFAVAFVIIVRGTYGASGVFSYFEDMLTARLLAEGLVVSALAWHFYGARRIAMLIAIAACFVHPLMALPGVLLLTCLWLSDRVATCGAIMAVTGVAMAATLLHFQHPTVGPLASIDGEWLYVVKQRSQFLFLQLWNVSDWEVCLRPFVCLTLTAIAMEDARIRKLCLSAMLVGVTGLLIAAISSIGNPVAILLQGQAWRWMWVPSLLSVALVAPTASRIWRDESCGPLCSLLLVLCWTFSSIDGLAIASLALSLWLIRSKLTERSALLLRWAAAVLGLVMVAWVSFNCWTIAGSPISDAGRESLTISRIRSMMGLGVSAVLVVFLIIRWIHVKHSLVWNSLAALALSLAAMAVAPGSLKLMERDGTKSEITEYAVWRNAIPQSATVYVMPARNSAAFAWFTLERPSYMSVDQSAGVVFSRATAEEIVRRSGVLLPVQSPDWQILDELQAKTGGSKSTDTDGKPMNLEALRSICRDPVLDFVIAREALDITRISHPKAGAHRDWNLYDCHEVRAAGFAA